MAQAFGVAVMAHGPGPSAWMDGNPGHVPMEHPAYNRAGESAEGAFRGGLGQG